MFTSYLVCYLFYTSPPSHFSITHWIRFWGNRKYNILLEHSRLSLWIPIGNAVYYYFSSCISISLRKHSGISTSPQSTWHEVDDTKSVDNTIKLLVIFVNNFWYCILVSLLSFWVFQEVAKRVSKIYRVLYCYLSMQP